MPIIRLQFQGKTIKEYQFTSGQSINIGRRESNDIVISNLGVSGTHARIDSSGQLFALVDLESTNGTFVNKELVTSRLMRDKDIILIGKHELIFELDDTEKSGLETGAEYDGTDKTMHLDTAQYRELIEQAQKDLEKSHSKIEPAKKPKVFFAPQVAPARQAPLSDDVKNEMISLYAGGMGYDEISRCIEEKHMTKVSPGTISAITDRVISNFNTFQSRALERVYSIMWFDVVHYSLMEQEQLVHKAIYTVLGINQSGIKEVLGFTIANIDELQVWLRILTDIASRGVEDILIACVGETKGFAEAIHSVFPATEVQFCVVHQTRKSIKNVAIEHQKEFSTDLKRICKAATKNSADSELRVLTERWQDEYPAVVNSWQNSWGNLSYYFKYQEGTRRIIYTTSLIEAVHWQFRKLTKIKGAFPTENSLLVFLYLGVQSANQKWTLPIQNWSQTVSQLADYFDARVAGE